MVVGAASVVLSPVSWTHHQVWLVLAVLLPVRGPAWSRYAWMTLVLAVMLLPVTALGGPVWTNARLLLAVAVVVAVRLDRPTTPTAGDHRGDQRQHEPERAEPEPLAQDQHADRRGDHRIGHADHRQRRGQSATRVRRLTQQIPGDRQHADRHRAEPGDSRPAPPW